MIRTVCIYSSLIISLFILPSCISTKRAAGEYKQVDLTAPRIVHLDSDNTGYCTWWADIQMTNKGTWHISNDTIFFKDLSIIHPEDKNFTVKKNKLVDENGNVYRKLNVFQRMFVYRGM